MAPSPTTTRAIPLTMTTTTGPTRAPSVLPCSPLGLIVPSGLWVLSDNNCTLRFLVIPEGSDLIVTMNLTIFGNVSVSGALIVFSDVQLRILSGNLFLFPSSRLRVSYSRIFPLVVERNMACDGASVLVTFPVSPLNRIFSRTTGDPVVQVPVASFASSTGTFSSVAVAPSVSPCDTYSNPVASFTSSTLSVAVSVSRNESLPGCQLAQPGLSGGAIAGIVVGTVVGAMILFTLGILLWRRKEIKEASNRFRKRQVDASAR